MATYIQSGNVVFASGAADAGGLAKLIETDIAARFGYAVWALVWSDNEMREVVAAAPQGYGVNLAGNRYDVAFVRPPLTPAAALDAVPIKPGVDEVAAGRNVLYLPRVLALAGKSRLPKLVQIPIYRDLTIRNSTTTLKLMSLIDRG